MPKERDSGPATMPTDRAGGASSADFWPCLQPLSLTLSHALNSEQVVDAIYAQGLAVLEGVAGSVYMLTEEGSHLEAVRHSGDPPQRAWQPLRFSLDQPHPLTDAVRQRET